MDGWESFGESLDPSVASGISTAKFSYGVSISITR